MLTTTVGIGAAASPTPTGSFFLTDILARDPRGSYGAWILALDGHSEAFSEFDVPLVNDAPFVKALSVNGGYRYSKYSVDGGSSFKANTYKFVLQYSPIGALKLRGSYNRAVRAPNIGELFTPQSPSIEEPFGA